MNLISCFVSTVFRFKSPVCQNQIQCSFIYFISPVFSKDNAVTKIFGIMILSIFILGCAAPASKEGMTVDRTETSIFSNNSLRGAIRIRNIIGGKETKILSPSQVDSNNFKAALEKSLSSMGYLSIDENAKRMIDAEIIEVDQPLLGLNFDVKSTVNYTMLSLSGSDAIQIAATGSATFGDSFDAVDRLKIANERSIKNNIKQFIIYLSNKTLK